MLSAADVFFFGTACDENKLSCNLRIYTDDLRRFEAAMLGGK